MAGTIICYGDSNTYGYDPQLGGSGRYEENSRWTGILKQQLEEKLENHGICGRCIPHLKSQIETACAEVQGWLEREGQIELWIMLGTNDLLQKKRFKAEDVALRMDMFIEKLLKGYGEECCIREGARCSGDICLAPTGAESECPLYQTVLDPLQEPTASVRSRLKIRLIAPPLMQYGAWVNEERLYQESRRLGSVYQRLAEKWQLDFTDAGKWELPVVFDGVHLTEEGHRIFAERLWEEMQHLIHTN